MSYKYFNIDKIVSSDDLKKQYRALALELHPDKGGNAEQFKEMGNEYESLFKTFGNIFKTREGETYTKETGESASKFKDIIDNIIKYDIDIDIVGQWIWIGGNTYPIKEVLKSLGFNFAREKKKWYYNGNGYKKKSYKYLSYEQIKDYYGCEKIKKSGDLKIC